jgi:hypothetical protein
LHEEVLAGSPVLRGRQQRHGNAAVDDHRDEKRALLHNSTSQQKTIGPVAEI